MLVQDIMHRPTFVRSDMTVEAVAEIMDFKDIGSVIVGTSAKPLGIFTERDILRKIVSKGVSAKRARVKDHMTSPVIAIDAEKTVIDAMRMMAESHIKRLPVVQGNEIVGMLSARSVMESVGRVVVRDAPLPAAYDSREGTPGFW